MLLLFFGVCAQHRVLNAFCLLFRMTSGCVYHNRGRTHDGGGLRSAQTSHGPCSVVERLLALNTETQHNIMVITQCHRPSTLGRKS